MLDHFPPTSKDDNSNDLGGTTMNFASSPQPVLCDEQHACEIRDKTLRNQGPRTPCGKILAHSRRQAAAFRDCIGSQVCVFKIGVTSSPRERFPSYRGKNFSSMWLIAEHHDVGLIHMLEAALIAEFHEIRGCRNAAESGGEGALNRPNHKGPPYYVYVTGGRADQFKRVG